MRGYKLRTNCGRIATDMLIIFNQIHSYHIVGMLDLGEYISSSTLFLQCFEISLVLALLSCSLQTPNTHRRHDVILCKADNVSMGPKHFNQKLSRTASLQRQSMNKPTSERVRKKSIRFCD